MADGLREGREGDQLPDFRGNLVQGALSRPQFLANGLSVDLGKAFFQGGLAIEEDVEVARVFQIPDQWGVGDHALE